MGDVSFAGVVQERYGKGMGVERRTPQSLRDSSPINKGAERVEIKNSRGGPRLFYSLNRDCVLIEDYFTRRSGIRAFLPVSARK